MVGAIVQHEAISTRVILGCSSDSHIWLDKAVKPSRHFLLCRSPCMICLTRKRQQIKPLTPSTSHHNCTLSYKSTPPDRLRDHSEGAEPETWVTVCGLAVLSSPASSSSSLSTFSSLLSSSRTICLMTLLSNRSIAKRRMPRRN